MTPISNSYFLDTQPLTVYKEADNTFSALEENGKRVRWTSKGLLSEGGQGEIRVVKSSLDAKDYIFKFPKNEDHYESILQEGKVLYKLNQKDPEEQYHIVKLTSIFSLERMPVLVFPRYESDLIPLIKLGLDLSFSRVLFFLRQVLRAVKYLHENQVIHRDIKPANIFVAENDQVKLGDFGIAVIKGEAVRSKTAGTRRYASPEYLLLNEIDYPMDVWAVGCVAAELLAKGSSLFSGARSEAVVEAHYGRFKETYPRSLLLKISNPKIQKKYEEKSIPDFRLSFDAFMSYSFCGRPENHSEEIKEGFNRFVKAMLECDPEIRSVVEESLIALEALKFTAQAQTSKENNNQNSSKIYCLVS